MIKYHGLPITPASAAIKAISGGHAFVSYAHADQLPIAVEVSQSFAIDNGAFSAWKAGNPVKDWSKFYDWAKQCEKIPSCDFAVIPDVIDGGEEENDALINECPLPRWFSAPVWHMHESIERLVNLATCFPRVCIGSSGEFSVVGDQRWWVRIAQAMNAVCDDQGRPWVKLHGLRMLNPRVFSKIPFSSADSTNIGRNVGIDVHWKGTYSPTNKDVRAMILRERVESHNAPSIWTDFTQRQENLI